MRSFLLAAAFWLAVGLVQIFNWDETGPWKALILLALLAYVPIMLRALREPHAETPVPRAVIALVAALAAIELVYGGVRLIHPRLIDMATTTLAAGHAMLAGQNPYTLPIDPEGGGAFAGYKYLPVMPAIYLPLGLALGARGVLVTNLLLQAAAVALMLGLGRRAGGYRTGFVAAALYLSLPLVAEQLFAKGTTDLAAIVPLLLAFVAFERSDFLSGLCVGLSIATKLFPGPLFVPCLLPPGAGARVRYGLGILCGMLPILPYAIAAPGAFTDNIILFNAIRRPDTTSWLAFAPDGAALVARSTFVALAFAITVHVWRRAPNLSVRCALAAALTLAVILAAPTAHHNYQLWWLPFYALALGATLRQPLRGLQKPVAAL
ncbi:MAG: hypothetical protein KGI43_06060 [Alphaproteobacteria bacterium]|nr:hypothetical protein [Alphaproteobacteria bacterium]